jgi:hypothetical protein
VQRKVGPEISVLLKGASRKSGDRGVTKNEMTTGNPGHSRQEKLNRRPALLGPQLGRPRPRFCRVIHAPAARLTTFRKNCTAIRKTRRANSSRLSDDFCWMFEHFFPAVKSKQHVTNSIL